MQKKPRSQKSYTNSRKKSFIIIIVLLVVGIGIYLSSQYQNLYKTASINKIIEVDPSTAKNSTQAKIIEKLNNAADREAKYKVDSKAHQEAVKDLYIQGVVYEASQEGLNKDKNEAELEKIAIDRLKATNAIVVDGKTTSILDSKGDLQSSANLAPIGNNNSQPERPSAEDGASSPDHNSVANTLLNGGECEQGKFGCPYKDIVWRGDEKCGKSIAGFYCWGGKYYVINNPATQDAANNYFAQISTLLSDPKNKNKISELISKQNGNNQEEKINNYLLSLNVFSDSTRAELTTKLKSMFPIAQTGSAPASGSTETAAEKAKKAAALKETCRLQNKTVSGTGCGELACGSGWKLGVDGKCVKPDNMVGNYLSTTISNCESTGKIFDLTTGLCTTMAKLSAEAKKALECKPGMQENGFYVTCPSNSLIDGAVHNGCTGKPGTEYVVGVGCVPKGTPVHTKGIFTGGERTANESDCIYGGQIERDGKYRCKYANLTLQAPSGSESAPAITAPGQGNAAPSSVQAVLVETGKGNNKEFVKFAPNGKRYDDSYCTNNNECLEGSYCKPYNFINNSKSHCAPTENSQNISSGSTTTPQSCSALGGLIGLHSKCPGNQNCYRSEYNGDMGWYCSQTGIIVEDAPQISDSLSTEAVQSVQLQGIDDKLSEGAACGIQRLKCDEGLFCEKRLGLDRCISESNRILKSGSECYTTSFNNQEICGNCPNGYALHPELPLTSQYRCE